MEGVKLTLKEIRQRKGYTQPEVAERVGITVTTYSLLENDIERRRSVKAGTMKDIADMLGVKMEDIL